jgi:hypothetical protein
VSSFYFAAYLLTFDLRKTSTTDRLPVAFLRSFCHIFFYFQQVGDTPLASDEVLMRGNRGPLSQPTGLAVR